MRVVAVRPAFVADRWRDSYLGHAVDDPLDDGRTWQQVEAEIRALPDDASVIAIDAVIGNHSWTYLECAECRNDIQRGVRVGYEEDRRYPGTGSYSKWGAVLCESCLRGATAALRSGGNEVAL